MIPRALLAVPLSLVGCQSPVDLSPGSMRPAPVIEANILRESNTLRGNRPTLVRVPSLDRAARQQAQAMARKRQLSHSAASGTLRSRTGARGRIGENIARVPDPSARGSVFVDLWQRSRGHRRNLLDRKFRKTGIGVVRRGGQTYAVQVFAE